MSGRIIRIGGASGFWGDSMVAAPQLVERGRLDYLVFDYLAETTMAILAGARRKRPELGYATDFVDIAMKSVLPEVVRQGIKVVANAGGINPQGCADALSALAASMGLSPRIAVVTGDDVSGEMPRLRAAGVADMFTGEALPERILSANAYLGALPIAQALAEGADIVITGRCVDSAVTLGPLICEFGWAADDHDLMAAGSLAGHIIECGCQATGGLHTDWEAVPDWPNIGYPVLECAADGSFIVTKPEGTGGAVLRAAVAEQMLYEIGDPAAYLLPDVSCDFSDVTIEQEGPDRVRVAGARGYAPPATYKVSATMLDGFRCAGSMAIVGIDAAAKARRTGEAVLARTRAILKHLGMPDYTRTAIEIFGAEGLYGPHARTAASREAMVRIVADHAMREALEIFAREIAPSGTSWAPGTTGPAAGRPSPSPLMVSQAAWDAGIRSVEDLRGKRVGIPGPGGFGIYSVAKALEKGGLSVEDVEAVFLPPPATAAAFANGALEAGWSIEPFASALETQGLGRRLVEDHTFGTELGFIAFNQDFVAANEDAVVRFMAGYLKAARLLDNGGWEDDAIIDIVAKYTGTERDTLRGIPYTVRSDDGAIDMDSVREQEAFFRARGALAYEGLANIDEVYRVDLLERANALLASNP